MTDEPGTCQLCGGHMTGVGLLFDERSMGVFHDPVSGKAIPLHMYTCSHLRCEQCGHEALSNLANLAKPDA
jgi:hypothetical protein